jgi:hypothetical protein
MPLVRSVEFDGPLTVLVHQVDIEPLESPLACWTLVTSGLARLGQREISLTVSRASDDPAEVPPGLLGYLDAVQSFAREGRLVDEGGISGYAAPGPFGFGSFVGVVFENAQPVDGVDLPADALAGVLLTEGELAMAQRSSSRVLSQLGALYRYYPWPYWSDPRRPSVYAPGDADTTILSKMPRCSMRNSTATLFDDDLHLVMPLRDAAVLGQQLESSGAAAVLPGRSPSAAGALVWRPGQTEPAGITAHTADASGLSTWFVAFVASGEAVDSVRFQEDGYAALLTAATTADLVRRLHAPGTVKVRDSLGDRSITVTVTA